MICISCQLSVVAGTAQYSAAIDNLINRLIQDLQAKWKRYFAVLNPK